jgi:hypothetical protein
VSEWHSRASPPVPFPFLPTTLTFYTPLSSYVTNSV